MISPAINLLLTVILCICLRKAESQTTAIDSLKKVLIAQKEESENRVNTLNELASKLLDSDSIEAALAYATEAKAIANKMTYKTGKAFAYHNLARFNIQKNNLTEALEFTLPALDMYTTLGNIRKTTELHTFSSYIYTKQFNLYQAIKSQYQALKGYEVLKDTPQIAYTIGNLATLHRAQGNNAEALQYHSAALKFYTKLKDRSGIANSYLGIGLIYNAEGKYQQALKMDSAALKLFKELKDDWSVAWCLSAIAKVFENQGSESYESGDKTLATEIFQKASKNYLSALKLFKDIESNDDVVKLNSRAGNINIKLGKFKEARPYLEKSLDEAFGLNDLETIQNNYKGLYKLDSVAGNYKQAFENYSKYILYRDSVFNDESKKKTLQLKMQYDFDKKEAATKAEQQMKDAAVRRTRNLQYFVIGVFLLLAIFLYWNIQQKQKAKSKIESAYAELKSTQAQLIQSEKMASLGELTAGIAHEIQNPLNFVNNFSEVNKEMIDDLQVELNSANVAEAIAISNDVKDNSEKISYHGKRADAIVKTMLAHSRVSSGKKELTNINALCDEYLRLAYHGIRAKEKSFNAEIKTDFEEHIGKINVVPQDIGRVLLNLYNNAFYAMNEKIKQQPNDYQPVISVTTKKINNSIKITVKDNGNGIPQNIVHKIFQPFFTTKPTGQGTGLGLSLSYDIIKAHGGEIKVKTTEGKGSELIINLQSHESF